LSNPGHQKIRQFLVLLICLLLPVIHATGRMVPDSSQAQVITAAVLNDFPPLYTRDQKGNPAGFAIDILEYVARRSGLTVQYLPLENWAKAMQAVRSGEADLIPGIGISPVRSAEFLFSEVMEVIPVSCFVRAGNQSILGIDSLPGHRVAVIGESAAQTRLAAIPGLELVPFPNIDSALFQLLAGDVDAFVFPEPVLKRKMRLMNIGDDHIKVVGTPLMELKRGFLLRKADQTLAARLDPVISEYTGSMQYLVDYQKWYGKPELFWTLKRIAWGMGVALIMILTVAIAWRNYSLLHLNRRLRMSEAHIRTMIETVPDLIWLKDPDGIYLDCNLKFERFFGAERSLIVGKTDHDFIDPELADFFREKDLAAMAIGKPCLNEEQVVYADDGHKELLETIKTPMFSRDGELIGILGVGRDITERKRAEGQIRLLSQAVEQSPVSVVITDSDASIEYVNSTFERVTGYRSAEVLGQHTRMLKSHRTPVAVYQEMWRTIISGKAWQGELQNRKKNGEIFWEQAHIAPVMDESGATCHYLAVKQDISRRKQQEERILHQAHFDALTDLPNRFLALDRLSQLVIEASRDGEKVAVLFLDLDDFKKVNDTMGHDIGDRLLIEAARRLHHSVRSSDTVGRLGGDEFIILLGGLKDAADARPVAENLLNGIRSSFRIERRELILTASIGIAVYPDDGDCASVLLRNADSAMYYSKDQGRNTYTYFTDSMNEGVSRRLILEEQMLGALGRGEFSLCYQPQMNVGSGQTNGIEALLRWHNPALGEISPGEFIPIAEQTGLIIPIGQFVLTEALRMAARWQQNREQPLIMAVNLSPRQFRDPSLVPFIEDALSRSGVPHDALELEITEGVLMSGHAHIDDALAALSRLGVSIAMDDFGTGYSSLSYLRRYPFDVLKIDRSFVNDITVDSADRELVNACIAMAHGLGLKVVAEGVETRAQLELLAAQGCDFAQGYLFSRPLSDAAITALFEADTGG
jgi:diguanylate cyclase (GGDEF)-like protein/PAS domain S-box-containing protein